MVTNSLKLHRNRIYLLCNTLVLFYSVYEMDDLLVVLQKRPISR